jgi:hypothetical protein
MNIVEELIHALEGSLKRFKKILYYNGVDKYVMDLHPGENFFQIVIESYVITFHIHMMVGESMTMLYEFYMRSE